MCPTHNSKYFCYRVDVEAIGEVNRETQGEHFKGIKELPSKKGTRPPAQLKCQYINTLSLGNKQQQMEATVLLGN